MEDVVIVSAARTAIGGFGGMFCDVSTTELGRIAAEEAIRRAGIDDKGIIDDVLFGNCMPRSDEINVARCISLKAGIPHTTPAATIQRQCSSGMQALIFGAQQIWSGENEIVLTGGVENMSRVPYSMYDIRWGKKSRDSICVDSLFEGLTDPLGGFLMGITAENLSEKYGISREEQDQHALMSNQRAVAAIDAGKFVDEIVPVPVPQRKGDPKMIATDEHPKRDLTIEALAKLKPAFKKDGTVTAGNASGLNDAASAILIMSAKRADKLGIKPLARIAAHAAAGVEPELMGYGPVPSTQKALKKAGLKLSDIDIVEVNEAFAAQYLACEKLLELDKSITNVNGSGIALGHPVGCTGNRLVVSLIYEMIRRDAKKGVATLCVGGGMGKTVIIER